MNPQALSDNWQRSSPYEQYVGRWSRRVAPPFLAWLQIPDGRRWLDVGCGTGALCAAIIDHCAPAEVIGIEPSAGFLATARESLGNRATLHPGSANEIPLGDAAVDVVVSALVLNFVPDQRGALAEMARVSGKSGTVSAYVWDYAGKMEFMRAFWDAAIALDPQAARLDEGIRFALCCPPALERLFADSGLTDIAVQPIDIATRFASFDEYWQPFLGGQGPAPSYAMSLDESARAELQRLLRSRLPAGGDGSISLVARAWAIRSRVPC